MIGEKLGAYEIEKEIGRGGMGRVYRAVQPSLGRTVAVKVLPADLARDEEFVERFMREAKATARLRHPGIVTVHDVGEQDGTYYFAMEYLPGRTLQKVIEQEGPLPVARAMRITTQLARALEHAHCHEILHRDVKPANVMLEGDDRAVLTDFGIARAASQTRLTQTGSTVGTPAYMSPEQVQGRSLDARSDLYSLGVILFEMLTGKLPYEGNTPPMVAYQHVNSPVRSAREVRGEIPEPLDALTQRLMAKDPEERFESAGELVRTLEEIGRGAAVPGVRESDGEATIPMEDIEESGEEATILIEEPVEGSGGDEDGDTAAANAAAPVEEVEATRDFSSVPLRRDSSPESTGRDSSVSNRPWSSPFAIVAASLMALLLGLGAYAYYTGSGGASTDGGADGDGTGTPPGATAEAPVDEDGFPPESAPMAEDDGDPASTAAASGGASGEGAAGQQGSSGDAATGETASTRRDDAPEATPGPESMRDEEGPPTPGGDSGSEGDAAGEATPTEAGEVEAAAGEEAPPTEAETEAAAPSPETFTITSRPEGARVSLDGEALPERTPVDVELLPDTRYDLELSLEDYESTSFRFAVADLSAGQRSEQELHFPLTRAIQPGQLRVDGDFGVQLEIGGTSYDLATGDEISLPPGSYEATLSASDRFYSERRSVEITSEETTALELPPITTITVAAAPSYCRVSIDGIDVGFVPTTVQIVLGSHEFRFDWETLEQTKTVTHEIRRDTERILEVPPER